MCDSSIKKETAPTNSASGNSSSWARYRTSSSALDPSSTSPLHLHTNTHDVTQTCNTQCEIQVRVSLWSLLFLHLIRMNLTIFSFVYKHGGSCLMLNVYNKFWKRSQLTREQFCLMCSNLALCMIKNANIIHNLGYSDQVGGTYTLVPGSSPVSWHDQQNMDPKSAMNIFQPIMLAVG